MKTLDEVLVELLEALLDYDIQDTDSAWWGFLAFHAASTVIKPQLLRLHEVDAALQKWESERDMTERSVTL